ncbi:hypothetical protein MCOR27_007765 [Pyricularia oryzae]|uniref:Uncharacterized protein n=2 Tax=Pyricularia TaxID=48558 RepID=A0ABQ8NSK2_PYRGI|nr:hypothetical protein MCOR01_011323 [Pyricularia oryzae]KAI6301495.1 hypothetical protein MCOR33_003020 [Pyricularia grisea]KAI6259340.1 hypothetical protein MCOR19_004361 [Pyricularia oryzae]KAI6269998.1 hypothetical protein MCOR26_008456 [Pyricularia oryzae]KAI6273706.1 hypothetical protein MCOR27_007765 [Pyricularia oryzae]
MRCSTLSSVWLLATASLALPSGDYSSHASNPGVKRASEPADQSFENWYTETATAPQLDERASEPFESWYTEKAAAPPLDKRAPAGPPAGKGVYTKAEWPWLEKKAAADATVDGLKNTTATLVDMFGKAKMPWIVSGGWALILYGQPNRKTTDMDIVIQTTMPNLKKLLAADPRFYVGAPGTWPDTEYLQVFFKNQDKFFDIDMIIAGNKESAKELGPVTKAISTTFNNAKLSVPVIATGPLFMSKAQGLANVKRSKDEQDVADISYLVETFPKDLTDMSTKLALETRKAVVNSFTKLKSKSLDKVKALLKV